MTIRFDGRVAVVTGAGGGLGREHALALAARGAKVVVNDFAAADAVAQQILDAGGEAVADSSSVTDPQAVERMVAAALSRWGRVDILVNNAGILRDRTFAKASFEEFREVIDVHLMGAVHCTKAVWETMRAQGYGRVVMTTSSSGLYGNFGQSNYGAAKMALVGLMNVLALEGAKHDIRVNCLAPTAATRMTQGILSPEALASLSPAAVTPGLLHLVSEDAPTKAVLCAGAGSFERAYVTLTQGVFAGLGDDAAERVAASFAAISDREGETTPDDGAEQGRRELANAGRAA